MLAKVVILIVFAAIIYNLGAGLYFMMSDKGQTDRMVRSLTWRIGISIALIVLVVIAILTGLIHPHGVAPGG
ncbi:MAG: twin transmembrane helix small protein [Lysobacterales bacterium]